MSAVDPRLLPVVLAVHVASSVTLTQVYRATFASQGGHLRFRDGLTVCLGAFSLTQLLPGGGAAEIYNGAIDNATGVAGIIEIAGKFATSEPKPKRSLVFVAVTLEESGLLGSA